MAFRPAVLDRDVLLVVETLFLEPVEKCRDVGVVLRDRRRSVDKADPWPRRLLRARDFRPCERGEPERDDNLAPPHALISRGTQLASLKCATTVYSLRVVPEFTDACGFLNTPAAPRR